MITLHTNTMSLDLDTVIYMCFAWLGLDLHVFFWCEIEWPKFMASLQDEFQVERNVFHYSAGIHACETLKLEKVKGEKWTPFLGLGRFSIEVM